jgi:hypothetical protein
MILFKGKKAKLGPVHTMNITLDDIRAVFFPKTFHEKYRYLGSVPWNEKGDIFKAMEPLVIFMDYKAKPKYCPRWFLRFLYLFGRDNSIVRVRNRKLADLHSKLTNGIFLVDYKTKWDDYDLRISICGDKQLNDLASDIETMFYRNGFRAHLLEVIKKKEPSFNKDYMSLEKLAKYADELEEKDLGYI